MMKRSELVVPALLIVLSVIPTVGGAMRLTSVAQRGPVTVENARFVAAPVPVVIHVVSATSYSLLGAFQFSPGLRQRWPRLHRRGGRLLVLCGLLAALSGMWMTAFYPIPTGLQGPLLLCVRLVVSIAMVATLAIGWSSIVRRKVARHEAFMIRAYALGQGAGTQVLVLGPWMLLSEQSGGLTRDLLMTLAWAINIMAAEWLIRSRRVPPEYAQAAGQIA